MEFSSSSKSRLTLKEFEVVNTSNYDIAGHFVDPQNKDSKRKQINIIKEQVMQVCSIVFFIDDSVAHILKKCF